MKGCGTHECVGQCALQALCWHAQEHFRSQKPEKTAAQLARQQAALLANVPEDQRGKLSVDMLNAATGLGMVNARSPRADRDLLGGVFHRLVGLEQGQWLSTHAGCAGQECCV